MNKHSREALDAYYADAASWNRDRVQAIHSSKRAAWIIAGAASVVALLEAIALVLLMPLKTVEPYTLMVDRTTGYVQALKPLDQAKMAPDATLTQSFLVQYVIAREGFDMATLNANYRKVSLFSADSARSSYLQMMPITNPQSPLNLLPRSTIVEVHVKSVSPIGHNAALVRFETVRSDSDAQPQPANPWVAVVRYRYSDAAMKLADRFVNPLGFQVVSYRKDPEALAPTHATSPTGTGAVADAPAVAPYYSPPPSAGPAR
jgi:type IV secretion system protein VirB8